MYVTALSQSIRLVAFIALIITGSTFGQSAAVAGWIDTKTLKPVGSVPVIPDPRTGGRVVHTVTGNPNLAYDPETGRNFARDACGDWRDTKTGQRVGSVPVLPDPRTGGRVVHTVTGNPNLAYDPETGRNFAREPCPTRTATTPPPTPQVGMVIEPKISVGLGVSTGTASYESTGTQAPFSGDWTRTNAQICGGATFWPGFVIGPARVGVDVNVCSGSNTFGGVDTMLFQINRHGPSGDVKFDARTNAIIDLLFKAEVPLGDPQAMYDPQTQRWFVSAGIGPTFRELNLTLTSNQTFFGGGVPSTSDTTWQTGLGLSAGLSTFVCPNCIAGNPLKVGVEGRARFFPSQSISLRSPAFGFTETGSTGRTTNYSVLLTFGMPISVP